VFFAAPQASRKHWWRFNKYSHPGLVDAFGRDGKLIMVLNTKGSWCSTCKGDAVPWANASWSCAYQGEAEQVVGKPIGKGDGKTLMVECALPKERLPTAQTSSVTIQADIDNHNLRYNGVPFCVLEGSASAGHHDGGALASYKYDLAGCTSVLGDAKFLLPEWLEYHLVQGYQHVTIFANEDPAEARALLRPFLAEGLVEVVDGNWPSVDSMQREAVENACIQRYSGRAKWVASHNVDEYFHPRQDRQTVADFLRENSKFEHLGAFQVLTQRFGSSKDEGVHSCPICQLQIVFPWRKQTAFWCLQCLVFIELAHCFLSSALVADRLLDSGPLVSNRNDSMLSSAMPLMYLKLVLILCAGHQMNNANFNDLVVTIFQSSDLNPLSHTGFKCLIRPENVGYFAVHGPADSHVPVVLPNPLTEIRVAHYHEPEENSMVGSKLVPMLLSWLRRLLLFAMQLFRQGVSFIVFAYVCIAVLFNLSSRRTPLMKGCCNASSLFRR
jgi:hypothetical protein